MATSLWVWLILALLPYGLAAAGGVMKLRQLGRLDNHHPRLQARQLTGVGARVWAAQANAWEALALYSAVFAVAHFAGVTEAVLSLPALGFLLTRILHPVCYLADWALARSLTVTAGLAICVFVAVQAISLA
ncbi:Uncharacterized conserved protein, MAPEG superfamily [Ferrimonas sediminum]|uniref:Uncharacterized conserved protein, MAPEG superfamily n=1 Tax=Ferrimonas sediminum TaxID=718193 RepID=A0A1G8QBS2_9GAMM|nr:MAPEG family protein [Ferrimonas sediminum]SDJ02048.1 Uncharacterized conserved protein, MAPEG superfamily [Ferrimonas sediminum]